MSNNAQTEQAARAGFPPHRLDALTDGIYAVAMTLLVIELKLPEHAVAASSRELWSLLWELGPRVQAWVISFGVLAMFWQGQARSHRPLVHMDGHLLGINLLELGAASLMPFSCALLGKHGTVLGQTLYSVNMAALALFALLAARYMYRHPSLLKQPMGPGAYVAAHWRLAGLMFISAVAVAIAWALGDRAPPGAGNMAFALMAVVMPLAARAGRRAESAVELGD